MIKGRIDRLDRTEDGLGFVIDYKYSKNFKEKLTDPKLLQGPLYLLAVERVFRPQARRHVLLHAARRR